eukprot:scaffold1147_cov250-Pinguiococcus_pyrenoidosus.AAC.14
MALGPCAHGTPLMWLRPHPLMTAEAGHELGEEPIKDDALAEKVGEADPDSQTRGESTRGNKPGAILLASPPAPPPKRICAGGAGVAPTEEAQDRRAAAIRRVFVEGELRGERLPQCPLAARRAARLTSFPSRGPRGPAQLREQNDVLRSMLTADVASENSALIDRCQQENTALKVALYESVQKLMRFQGQSLDGVAGSLSGLTNAGLNAGISPGTLATLNGALSGGVPQRVGSSASGATAQGGGGGASRTASQQNILHGLDLAPQTMQLLQSGLGQQQPGQQSLGNLMDTSHGDSSHLAMLAAQRMGNVGMNRAGGLGLQSTSAGGLNLSALQNPGLAALGGVTGVNMGNVNATGTLGIAGTLGGMGSLGIHTLGLGGSGNVGLQSNGLGGSPASRKQLPGLAHHTSTQVSNV